MNNIQLDVRLAELSPISDSKFAELAHADARDELLARVVSTDPKDGVPTQRRLRHRLPVVAGVGVTVVASSAAIGWALSTSGATDTVAVQCEIDGTDAITPAVS